MNDRFASISAFAEIGDFIDQPVKTYSSGMFVRLAFGLVSHVDADILVVDEALAVGDVFFQQKCMRFLRTFQLAGGTILFVTHDTGSVLSLCKKALLLYSGGVLAPRYGNAEDICKLYLEDIYSDHSRVSAVAQARHGTLTADMTPLAATRRFESSVQTACVYNVSPFRNDSDSFGERGATIVDARFIDEKENTLTTLYGGQRVTFLITVLVNQRIAWPAFGFMLKNALGEFLYTEGTDLELRDHKMTFEAGELACAEFSFDMPHLMRGKYMMNVAFAEGVGDEHIQHHWIHDAIEVDSLSSRVAHGYSGMNNLKIKIDVTPTAAPAVLS